MLEKFARYPLTFGPTSIENLQRLSAHLGGAVDIFAKRDDCNSGLAFGGNKIRKLEYIVPDAIAADADTLVTIGGIQSNHTRQVAATAWKEVAYRPNSAISLVHHTPELRGRDATPEDGRGRIALRDKCRAV